LPFKRNITEAASLWEDMFAGSMEKDIHSAQINKAIPQTYFLAELFIMWYKRRRGQRGRESCSV